MKKKKNSRVLFYSILICTQLIVIFISGEILIRIFAPQKTYADFKELVGSYYAYSPFNRLTLKKNYSGFEPSMEYRNKKVKITTNSLGLRNKEINADKQPGVKRILILGDSYTFGVYVDDNETFSARLESLLQEDGYKIEVINAGYTCGWETDEQYVWLLNEGLKLNPDIVILGFFLGNDITGINPDNWMGRDKKGLPIKIHDKDLYIDETGRIRSKKSDNKTVGSEFIYRIPVLRESQLLILLSKKFEYYKEKVAMRLRNRRNLSLPPPGASVYWYPQVFGASAEKVYEKYNSTYLQRRSEFDQKELLFKKLLEGMRDLTRENGIKFAVLMIPFNFQVEPGYFLHKVFALPDEQKAIKNGEILIEENYFDRIEEGLEKKGIKCLDLLGPMRRANGKYYPRNGEVHFNPDGHIFVAEAIKWFIIENNWLK